MASIRPEDLGRWFDAQAPALRLYARQWCDGTAADDTVQEAFVSLAQQSVVPDHVAAWLHRVVRNAAISAGRNQARRKNREERASSGEAWFASADDQLDARDAASMLAEIDVEYREVVVARIWGGLTFDQIARLQGCSLTSAHRRYQDGLAKLHERLERPCSNQHQAGRTR
jgi:RNA polymerase sigma-70 factor (ECF subfamily)